MISLDDVRRIALALPETDEHTHYRLPAFRVAGTTFLVVKPGKSALLHVNETDAQTAIDNNPAVFELERPGRPYGIWANLASVTPEQLQHLTEQAWRTHAPKTLLDKLDE